MKKIVHHPFVRKHSGTFFKFAVVGGTGAFIDLGSLHVMVKYLEVSPYIAPIISTLLSVTFVFLTNKFFTFKNREKRYAGQAAKFAIVYGIAIVANIATTTLLIALGVHYLLAKVIAIGLGMFWNYFMSHGFVFKHKHGEGQVEVVVA